jgi:hypothetical protein
LGLPQDSVTSELWRRETLLEGRGSCGERFAAEPPILNSGRSDFGAHIANAEELADPLGIGSCRTPERLDLAAVPRLVAASSDAKGDQVSGELSARALRG